MLFSLSKFIARLVVHRPWALAGAGVFLFATCAVILFSRQSFDTDILNLLPADRPAVKGLKIANERFTQARELTFVIQSGDADIVESFQAFLAGRLRGQPWVVRLLDGPPLETPAGRADLQRLLVPLLLNLPPEQFRAALGLLDPAAIRDRLARLRRQMDAGSPMAHLELESDPIGLLASAAKPLWESSALSDAFDLASPDGRLRLLPVVTNQPTLDSGDCHALMETVRTFLVQTRRDFGPEAPSVSVTGRTAYVDEISRSMQRDIFLTSIVSLLTVTALFWFSFRRLLPLLGVALLLAASAFITLTIGSLLFHQLNVIAIGFCSILFGLGDDFGLLLYEGYRHKRGEGLAREASITASVRATLPGILWVTLTTAIGFLALTFSGSAGFAQLGAMVAIGVAICAALVTALLFLFIRDSSSPPARSNSLRFLPHASRILFPALFIFGALGIFALSPIRPLTFDTSPHSLEPRDIPAARALQDLMNAWPDSFEPSLVIIEFSDSAKSAKLDAHLRELIKRGLLDGFSSPTALLLDPAREQKNRSMVNPALISTVQDSFRSALVESGFDPGAFRSTSETLSALAALQPTSTWKQILPSSSPWWFVIDRMLTTDGTTSATFLKPTPIYRNAASAGLIEQAVNESGIPVYVTGWTQTLGTLVAWAKHELLIFGGGVAGLILFVLAIVYRNPRDWLAHTLGLAFAAGATVATLKLAGVQINLLNVLAFPLMLAVGVDYGMHLVLAAREGHIATVIKPVAISGLTTIMGFASLMLAKNPSLHGLGTVCAIGVAWSLIAAFTIVLPLAIKLRNLREAASGDKLTV